MQQFVDHKNVFQCWAETRSTHIRERNRRGDRLNHYVRLAISFIRPSIFKERYLLN